MYMTSGKTRRQRLRRWMMRGVLVLMALIALGGLAEEWWRQRLVRRYPAPGTLVEIDGQTLHLDCRGHGSPTVVFESGLDNMGALSWAAVHAAIAGETRACAYSRAGIMWSSARTVPVSATSIAEALHDLLVAAGERQSVVLVAHSLGGPYAMAYVARYPAQVDGLVLVDASHPDQQQRVARATGLPRRVIEPPARLLRIGALLGRIGVLHLLPMPAAPDAWPAAARTLPTAFLARSIAALRDETLALRATLVQAGLQRDLAARPLVVLTAGRPESDASLAAMGMTREQEGARRREWIAMHEEMATWSRRGKHELVPDASHYIQFDRPDVVIRAVLAVVTDARRLAVGSLP